MTLRHDRYQDRRERGSALAIVLLATTAVLSIGMGLASLTATETAIAGYQRASVEAFYAADGAIESAAHELMDLASWDPVLDGTARSAWGRIVTTASGLDVAAETAAVQAETIAELGSGADVPVWRLYAHGSTSSLFGGPAQAAPLDVVVWVADDASERDGDPGVDSNGVIALLARAFGPTGVRRGVAVSLARGAVDESSSTEDGEESSPMMTRMISWRDLR